MMRDEQALWTPSPNFNSGRAGYTPAWVILHGTAGGTSAQNVAGWLSNPASGVSAHYIVGQDGTILQLVDEADWAWANGVLEAGADPWWSPAVNPNLLTISIEHVKAHDDNSDALTDAQKHASFGLVKRICQRWNIPMRKADANGGITGHFSIAPQSRARCPGLYPWDELWQFLGASMSITLSTPGVGTYFTGDAQNWHCPATGKDIANAMLTFYQNFGGSGLGGLTHLGLPITGERGLGNGATVQLFERGALVYDPGRQFDNPPGVSGPVYLAHVYGATAIGHDPTIDQLVAQIQQLKATQADAPALTVVKAIQQLVAPFK